MEVNLEAGDISRMPADAIIVNLFEGVQEPGGATKAVDDALGGAISHLVKKGEIKGKASEVTLIHTFQKIQSERVLVLGLGKQDKFTLETVRNGMAVACRALRKVGAKRVATIIHGAGAGGVDAGKAVQAIVEGSLLGCYRFGKHVTKQPENGEISELIILDRDESRLDILRDSLERGRILAEATNLARDLVNEPANFVTPSRLAEISQQIAASLGLECSVLDRDEMEKLGMEGLLGVAQGSHQPPKFIILKYRGNQASDDAIGFVGKGITFDSGGIDIKSSEGMEDMKGDMSGAAAVIAALKAVAELKVKINLTAFVPAAENLPGGSALKPGDIVKALNGKTIEVANTDAEGRLALADALSYARKQKVSSLVDIATLTGACHVALGDICTGSFGNNRELMEKVIRAGEEAGEKIWELPMFEEYKEQNKSDVADIKNTGGRYGGAITAAQFLAEFSEDTPWVHLDIAGTFMSKKDQGYLIKGATGIGVRTLATLALYLQQE